MNIYCVKCGLWRNSLTYFAYSSLLLLLFTSFVFPLQCITSVWSSMGVNEYRFRIPTTDESSCCSRSCRSFYEIVRIKTSKCMWAGSLGSWEHHWRWPSVERFCHSTWCCSSTSYVHRPKRSCKFFCTQLLCVVKILSC